MKEFKVATYLSVSAEITVCAEDRAEAVAKVKELLVNGELKPDEICVERESSWAYPTGCKCDAHNHPPAWAREKSAKARQNDDASRGAAASEMPTGARELLHHLLGAV